MIETDENIYFMPGEIVMLKSHDQLGNSPKMLVIGKVSSIFKNQDTSRKSLKGIKCIWFDKNQVLHEYIFNTKDLIKI